MFRDVPLAAHALGNKQMRYGGIYLADHGTGQRCQRVVASRYAPAQRFFHNALSVRIKQSVRPDIGITFGFLDHTIVDKHFYNIDGLRLIKELAQAVSLGQAFAKRLKRLFAQSVAAALAGGARVLAVCEGVIQGSDQILPLFVRHVPVKLAHKHRPLHGVHIGRIKAEGCRALAYGRTVCVGFVGELFVGVTDGHGAAVAAKNIAFLVNNRSAVVCVYGFQQERRVKVLRVL